MNKKYDFTKMKAILENDLYAVYQISKIENNNANGIRLNKKTNEIVNVKLQIIPKIRVIDIINQNKR